jgi:hypothetical protein
MEDHQPQAENSGKDEGRVTEVYKGDVKISQDVLKKEESRQVLTTMELMFQSGTSGERSLR